MPPLSSASCPLQQPQKAAAAGKPKAGTEQKSGKAKEYTKEDRQLLDSVQLGKAHQALKLIAAGSDVNVRWVFYVFVDAALDHALRRPIPHCLRTSLGSCQGAGSCASRHLNALLPPPPPFPLNEMGT